MSFTEVTRATGIWLFQHTLSDFHVDFDRMEIRPDQYNETQFLPGSNRIDTAIGMHYFDANKTAGEKAWRQLHKNVESNIEQVLAATPHKAPTIRPPASHHKNYPS